MNYSINYAFDCLNALVHGKPWLSRSSCSVLHTCRVLPNSLIMRNSMMLSSPNFKPAPARSIVISPPKDSPYLTRTLNDTAALQIYLYHILFSCKINLNLNVSHLNYQLWGNIWTLIFNVSSFTLPCPLRCQNDFFAIATPVVLHYSPTAVRTNLCHDTIFFTLEKVHSHIEQTLSANEASTI